MAELTANPDGCSRFEPNPFKKEKCKACGRHWTEHKGAIDDKFVNDFLAVKRKAEEDKKKAEEEAKAKAAAKKMAQKKENQAVEDEWLFDGSKNQAAAEDVDSDDDLGFRMFTAADLAGQEMRPQKSNATLKVVNLIDFGECDVPEDSGAATGSSTAASAAADQEPMARPGPTPQSLGALMANPVQPEAASPSEDVQHLHGEIEYLRQLLANANEERSIQVAIVQDEVAAKEAVIEDMRRQQASLQESLREAREALERDAERHAAELSKARGEAGETAATSDAPAAGEAAEIERLKAELASAEARAAAAAERAAAAEAAQTALAAEAPEAAATAASSLEEARAAAAAAEARAEALARENERLRSEASGGAAATGGPPVEQRRSSRSGEELKLRKEVADTLRELRHDFDRQLLWLQKRSQGAPPAAQSVEVA